MTFKDEIRKIMESLTPTPVAVEQPDPKRAQIAILQMGGGDYRTVITNGTLYAWKEQKQ